MVLGSLRSKAQRTGPELNALAHRVVREVRTLDGVLSLRVGLLGGAAQQLPDFALAGIRTQLLRGAGLTIGRRTTIQGKLHFVGSPRDVSAVVIGEDCIIAPGVSIGLDAPVTIGNRVALGPKVTLCTATHGVGFGSRRMNLETEARPITIGDGAWVCMHALILPGVTIGAGAIVGAQSVVMEDVAPHTLVVGNPAKVHEQLPFAQR